MTGAEVASRFIFADEFKAKNYCDRHYAIALYNAFMGREPSEAEIANWTWRLQEGDTREEVFNFFATSDEFGGVCAAAGVTLGSAVDFGDRSTKAGGYCTVDGCRYNDGKIEFVRRLYTVCLDREPGQSEVDAWHYNLVHGDYTGTSASRFFLTSPEFTGHNYTNAKYIEHLYDAMIGREPGDEEFMYWMWRLTATDANHATREQLIDEFAATEEFKVICQQYGVVHS